ncbi:uncharacterized protein LOC110684467 [Chenopodium quinoa]|uniref:uncharacterized protein LOC110684467 n=1 Tax=Chenopodium quinoa TaxID=63459 RepID=UPI000B78F413|nr:uncharacterized protein LOC110684467 [Chenopodium quinoa]
MAPNLYSHYQNVVLIGDFNQVEYSSDKVGGSPNIVGQTDFQDWKFDSGLLDIPFSGPTFTWTNGHHNGNPTFERLDKAYATNDWLIKYPDTSILHQPILFSDHAAIILREHRVLEGRKPYRVDNWCLLSKEVASIVSFSWKLDILGSPMFSISQRLEDLLIEAIQYFFLHGHLLKEWNRTFIVLIPKVDHPQQPSQFRPIGLCNVLYKCITKCLAARLRMILPSLISDCQTAFVPGRLMSDNGLLAHEILTYMNHLRGRTMSVALKLDMNKAYDRVNWQFLRQALQKFGFPPYWIHIIQQCVSTVSYQLLVNGNPTKVFRPSCGLRQGDPLSSYLFVLCMEIFSAMINQAESTGLFKGVKVSRYAPSISHLFFADDSLLFFQTSPQACSNVLGVVHQFCDISGQMLNLQKSFVRFSPNVQEDYRESLANSLQLKSLPSLGTYLGLPVDMGRSKRTPYQPLVDKITSRLMSFASLHLSPAAKLVVINSVLIASLNHILSVFKIPSSISDRINNLFVRFWWKTGNHSKGLALTPPSVLFTPKGLGGLGIRHLGLFNSALLARQSWRIMQNSQLLISRVFQAKYPSLMCFRSQGRLSNPSWGCRSVLHGIQTLKIGLAWKIGNGSKVHILQDSWVPGSPVYFKNSLAGSVQPTLMSSLLDPISNDWDPALIHALFPSTIASKILSLERPPQLMDDYVYWKYSRDGRFSSKSAYAKLIALSNQLPEGSSPIPPIPWSKIWVLPILPKWKLFIWKKFHNALPVADTLRTKGRPVDPVCSFCFQDSETTEHLLLRCSFIRRLWHCGPLGIRLPCFNSSFHQWFSSLLLCHIYKELGWFGLYFIFCLGHLDSS